MKTSTFLLAGVLSTSMFLPSAFGATRLETATPPAILAKKAGPIDVGSPASLALAALKKHEARLMRCLHGRSVTAQVRLRVNAHGWTDVLEVTPADGRVGTCLRVIMEELHFPKGERAMFKGEIVVPVHVSSKFVLPKLQAAHATLWSLDDGR